jgi:hypothetical protein
MGKRIAIRVLSVLVGVVVGMVVMTALHQLSALAYPMPAGVDPMSTDPAKQEQMKAWLATLPAGAFALAIAAHSLGAMSGAIVATLITRRQTLAPAVAIGVIFTFAGIANLREIPHPAWFGWVDLPLYSLLSVGAGLLLVRKPAAAA